MRNFEFVPYTVSRPPKKDVIADYGYGAILRGGIMRALNGILLTIWRLLLFPFFLVFWKIDLVQISSSPSYDPEIAKRPRCPSVFM